MAEQEGPGPERDEQPQDAPAADDAFLQSLGLREHPFVQRSGTVYVYFDPERSDALVRLADALLQGAPACVVVGPEGAGKTAFLSKLAARVLSVSAAMVLTGEAATGSPLQRILAAGSYFEETGHPAFAEFAIGGVIAPPASVPATSVLFVENADSLSSAAWERFRTWHEGFVEAQGPLGVVLSADDETSVREQWPGGQFPETAEVIVLAPLGVESSKSLVAHRVEKAGGRLDAVFSADAVERLCEVAAGNPGLIVELCRRCVDAAASTGAAPVQPAAVDEVAQTAPELGTRIEAAKAALATRSPEPATRTETAGPTGSEAIEMFDVGTIAASDGQKGATAADAGSLFRRRSFASMTGYAAALTVLVAGGLFAASTFYPLWDRGSERRSAATWDGAARENTPAPPASITGSDNGEARDADASARETAAASEESTADEPDPQAATGPRDEDRAPEPQEERFARPVSVDDPTKPMPAASAPESVNATAAAGPEQSTEGDAAEDLAEMSTASGSDKAEDAPIPGDVGVEIPGVSQPTESGTARFLPNDVTASSAPASTPLVGEVIADRSDDLPAAAAVSQASPGKGTEASAAVPLESGDTADRLQTDSTAARAMVSKGDGFLELGDLASARLFYLAAVERGSATAAARLGQTFDPIYFEQSGVRGARAEPEQAVDWYRKAIQMGDDTESPQRLEQLLSRLRTAADAGDVEAKQILKAVGE